MILVYRSRGVMSFFDIFAYIVVISSKTVNQLRTRFLTFLHKTRGDMSFVTFLLIQL